MTADPNNTGDTPSSESTPGPGQGRTGDRLDDPTTVGSGGSTVQEGTGQGGDEPQGQPQGDVNVNPQVDEPDPNAQRAKDQRGPEVEDSRGSVSLGNQDTEDFDVNSEYSGPDVSALLPELRRMLDDPNEIPPTTAIKLKRLLNRTEVYEPIRENVVTTKVDRDQNEFVKHGIRQSMGGPIYKKNLEDDDEEKVESDLQLKRATVTLVGQRPIIDGTPLDVDLIPIDVNSFAPPRYYDKRKRHLMPGDVRQAYIRGATSRILNKNSLISLPQLKTDEENGLLVHVQNLQAQKTALRAHMQAYDIYDVMTIVVPVDVATTGTIENVTYDLFDDHTKLHEAHVANSCTWYNRWVKNDYVRENMSFILTFLQNNTDEYLWSKSLERYEEFTPIQRGGPLIAFIILRKIQDSSEQALEHLRVQVGRIDISKFLGEDVDKAVSLIKSTYKVLKSSSTMTHTYVPQDFVQTIFKVLQTTTVSEFNEAFKKEHDSIQLYADKHGTKPKWPSVTAVLSLATNMYRRLKSTGDWDAAVGRQSKAYNAQLTSPSGGPQSTLNCWNCGGNHMLKDCPKPKVQATIDAARKKYLAARKNKKGGPPKRKKDPTGRPLIRNKNGVYVLDQKKYKAYLAAHQGEVNAQNVAVPASANPVASPVTPPTPQGNIAVRADALRNLLRESS